MNTLPLTSDGGGKSPSSDVGGNLVKIEIGYPESILKEIADVVRIDGISIKKAVAVSTYNIANILKLESKGPHCKRDGCRSSNP